MRLVLLVVLAAAGCFSKPKPSCAFLCGPAGDCPENYRCGADDRCHLVVEGQPLACEDELPGADAAMIADAAIGGEADAGAAAPDAEPADAEPADAEPADAEPADAEPADADVDAGP